MDVESIAMFGTAPMVIQAHHKKQIPSHRGSVVADDLGEVPSLPTAFVPYFVDFMVFASLL